MFVRLLVARLYGDQRSDEGFASFDANNIIFINSTGEENGCRFTFVAGADTNTYHTPSYDEAGLVELVMQARLYPDQFLPSNNVGKGDKVELGSTGSHHWSSKQAQPKRN